jgi:hypothetical protein
MPAASPFNSWWLRLPQEPQQQLEQPLLARLLVLPLLRVLVLLLLARAQALATGQDVGEALTTGVVSGLTAGSRQ